jgi:hypothetical protein
MKDLINKIKNEKYKKFYQNILETENIDSIQELIPIILMINDFIAFLDIQSNRTLLSYVLFNFSTKGLKKDSFDDKEILEIKNKFKFLLNLSLEMLLKYEEDFEPFNKKDDEKSEDYFKRMLEEQPEMVKKLLIGRSKIIKEKD